MPKYLVTGGAGFIGSHLTDALIERGDGVVVLDNLSTGKIENVNTKAIFIKGDICDLATVHKAAEGTDGIFHVAARARVQPSIADPLPGNDINITGTLNVLWAAKELGGKKVVYSSSSSVYGPQEKMPLEETFIPNPLSPYALQKWVGEEYCKLFSKVYGLPTISLRYFNVYGPRMIEGGAYATALQVFLGNLKRGEPLTIFGDGEQSRDFTHVTDVVSANLLAIENSNVGSGEVLNIAPGKSYTINQIAALLGGKVVYAPGKLEPRHTLADNSRARELLNWQPTIKLEDTISDLKHERGLS
jgi:nucleoside-diphosphate-sugar epimerase